MPPGRRTVNDWTPKPHPSAALAKLPLTPEEGFVLSRLDGATPVRHLTALTGLPAERIQAILARLVEHGAVLPAPVPPPEAAAGKHPAEDEEPTAAEEEEAPEEASTEA